MNIIPIYRQISTQFQEDIILARELRKLEEHLGNAIQAAKIANISDRELVQILETLLEAEHNRKER